MYEGPLKEIAFKGAKEGVRQMSEIGEMIREQGYQSGIKIGEARGVEKGRTNEKRSVAIKMIAKGEADDRIHDYTGLSIKEINTLKQK